MDRLTIFGRVLFSIALIGLGVTHFFFESFNTGRAPAWPGELPGELVWIYLSGLIFIATGFAILLGKKARQAVIFAGAIVFIWALLRHLPVVAVSSFPSGAWTDAGKALRLIGGALAIAATLPLIKTGSDSVFLKFLNLKDEFVLMGRVCLGPTLILNGIQHFIFTDFVASLIPNWFPGDAIFWTWFGGIALIAGGIGLLISQTARLAALLSGVMIFSWFWIIHLPRTLTTVSDGIAVFEVLVSAGTAFVIAGFLYEQKTNRNK